MENLLPLADRQDPISVAVQLSCSALDRQAEKKTGYFTVSEKNYKTALIKDRGQIAALPFLLTLTLTPTRDLDL